MKEHQKNLEKCIIKTKDFLLALQDLQFKPINGNVNQTIGRLIAQYEEDLSPYFSIKLEYDIDFENGNNVKIEGVDFKSDFIFVVLVQGLYKKFPNQNFPNVFN